MPYIELYYPEDNIACAYWQSGNYFYRQYENETKAKRICCQLTPSKRMAMEVLLTERI